MADGNQKYKSQDWTKNKEKQEGAESRDLKMTHLNSDKHNVWMRIGSLGPKQAVLSKVVTEGQERICLISGDDD